MSNRCQKVRGQGWLSCWYWLWFSGYSHIWKRVSQYLQWSWELNFFRTFYHRLDTYLVESQFIFGYQVLGILHFSSIFQLSSIFHLIIFSRVGCSKFFLRDLFNSTRPDNRVPLCCKIQVGIFLLRDSTQIHLRRIYSKLQKEFITIPTLVLQLFQT